MAGHLWWSAETPEQQKKADELLAQINELHDEMEEAPEWIIDCVLDNRKEDGFPDPAPEELAEIEAECAKNEEHIKALEDRLFELRNDYMMLTGAYPVFRGYRYDHREPDEERD